VAVREWNDEIIFLHKVRPGGTDRSYGIQVARLAGLPPAVIARAKVILGELERERSGLQSAVTAAPSPEGPAQLGLFPATRDPLLLELAALDLGAMTPLQALNRLAEWQQQLKARPRRPRGSAGSPIISSTRSRPGKWWSVRPRW
jgi:DNA mismatch repair protein MutS